MSKAFKWPKLPNSRPYLDKGYTSIQMREYALKCIGEAIRNKQWQCLTFDEQLDLAKDVDWAAGAYCEYAKKVEDKLKEKNCGQ